MAKRQPYEAKAKLFGGTLTHMRDVAYGMASRVHIFKTVDRAEKMRPDDDLLTKAEAKRQRKAAQRLKGK